MRKVKEYHGLTKHPLFWILDAMKQRCYNKNNCNYHNYGARGIFVCNEWLVSVTSFYNWAMNNGYENGLEIERINNNWGYEPSNCKWATRKEQTNNTRQNRMISIDGVTKTLKQWCDELGFDYDLASNRLNQHKWPEDQIFRKEKGKHLVIK